jgi:hypothetical protein
MVVERRLNEKRALEEKLLNANRTSELLKDVVFEGGQPLLIGSAQAISYQITRFAIARYIPGVIPQTTHTQGIGQIVYISSDRNDQEAIVTALEIQGYENAGAVQLKNEKQKTAFDAVKMTREVPLVIEHDVLMPKNFNMRATGYSRDFEY